MLIFIMNISKIMSSLPSLLTFSFALIWFLFRPRYPSWFQEAASKKVYFALDIDYAFLDFLK